MRTRGSYVRIDSPLDVRFWDKVDKSAGPDACWLWKGRKTGWGYGQFSLSGLGVPFRNAHRVAYELMVGPIPEGLVIDHVRERGCVNKHCVNPAHLEAVTQRTNALRGVDSPTAINAAKTHCVNGHEFTPENTLRRKSPDGRRYRECHICRKAISKRSNDKRPDRNKRKAGC